MDKYLPVICKIKLFDGIDVEEVPTLLACFKARVRRYRRGEYVLRQGEPIDEVAVVLEGALHIQYDDYWGNRSILGQLGVGDMFGEAYVFSDGTKLMNDVVAVEDSAVMFMNAQNVVTACASACASHNTVIRNMFFVLAAKNRNLVQKLGYVSKRSTREKLIAYLSQEAKRQGRSDIEITFNRQQLADFLAVDRSAMSKELCKMRDEGLLTFRKNSFRLL